MVKIQKTLSYEELASRLPSVVPAYLDGKLYYFDEDSLRDDEYAHLSNYGMVPIDVVIDGNEYSFRTVSKMYRLFSVRESLVKDKGTCGKQYGSATEYYEVESAHGSSLELGNDKTTYEEIDRLFDEYGGDDMYSKFKRYVVPIYDIPSEYVDKWNKKRLFYPDVIRWRNWFAKYQVLCQSNDDDKGICCDCEKYEELGGDDILSSMTKWVAARDYEIKGKYSKSTEPKGWVMCQMALETDVANVGFYSQLSENYELGVDYRVSSLSSETNNMSGTVVSYEGKPYILKKNDSCGYTFDNDYKEMTFDDDAWSGYTQKYLGEHGDELRPQYKDSLGTYKDYYYAFDKDNKKLSGTTVEVLKGQFKKYNVAPNGDNANGYYYIDGVTYPIINSEYFTTKNGEYIIVYRDSLTNIPYIIDNGEEVYANFFKKNGATIYYFPSLVSGTTVAPSPNCSTARRAKVNPMICAQYPENVTNTREFIFYNGSYVPCNTIQSFSSKTHSLVCKRYVSYLDYEGGRYFIDSSTTRNSSIYVDGNEVKTSKVAKMSSTSTNNLLVDTYDGETIYSSSTVVGRTISKLLPLKSLDILTDDIGNKIDGIYNNYSNATNHQPIMGTTLEIPYMVGNVANVYPIKVSETDSSLYIGDIITSITLYCKNYIGDDVTNTGGTIITASTVSDLLTAISNDAEANVEAIKDTIYGIITYHVGATIKFDSSTTTYSLAPNYDSGVKYTENVTFNKTVVDYYLSTPQKDVIPTKRNGVEAHSVSYPIYVYEMTQDVQTVKIEAYDETYECPMADFEYKVFNQYLTNTDDLDETNGVEYQPVMMEEFNVGSSMVQNVENDIYIDRGISAAFEKHLKLGEVSTLEALINYTNGYFDLMTT